ncbi:hypothetical protein H0H81_002790, partial [Sphagnurus paluster]
FQKSYFENKPPDLVEGHDPCRTLATINDLPFELLLIIFNFSFWSLFVDQQYDPLDYINPESETIWPTWSDVQSLDLFPYAFAYVCRKWDNVMRTTPLFWTRIVIFIDEKLSVRQAKAHLELSGNFALDLTVTRRNREALRDNPAEEYTIAKGVLETISPHIPRCRKIAFNLAHTSSLPRLTTDFHHPALLLDVLSLNATASSGLGGLTGSRHFILHTSFPMLTYLDIDGHNFVDTFRHAPEWFSNLNRNADGDEEYATLCIRKYKPDVGDNPQGRFFIFDAFEAFHGITDFELDGVDFAYTARTTAEMDMISVTEGLDCDEIKLSDLSAQLTAILVSKITTQNLHIIDSPLHDITVLPECDKLSLGGINFPLTALDLRFLLASWRGTDLSLLGCTIDDTVLEMMGTPRAGQVLELNAPCLEQLLLSECSGFSEEAVKSLREARQIFSRIDPGKISSLTLLHLSARNGTTSCVPTLCSGHVSSSSFDEKLSVRQAKAHLELSGNFAINLTVTRRSRDAFVDDPAEEHTITKSIMQTIAPHIPRCCTISFDLAHTSSLPRLTTDFHHRALLLNGLSLNAAATNGLGGLNGSTKFKLATIFPQVSYLDIDGHNFVDIFRHEPDWFTYFTLNGLEIQEQSMLYIRNYKPDAGENPQGRFFVFDAFEVFDYFGDLGLHNVDFDYTARSTSEMNAISNTDIYLDDFKLSDLSAQLTAVLVSNIRAQHLSIINCPLRDVTVFQECIDLSLGNINFPRTALDLRFLLSSWRGTDLSLFDCTIDDTVLEMMGSPRLGPELELNAPRLEHLLLCHCSGVSEEAVVSLREAREAFNRNDVEKYFNVVVRAPVIS